MDTTIDDVLAVHDKKGYLVVVSDGSVINMHQMSFGWVLASAKGQHLVKLFGGCDGKENSLQAEAVGILSIAIFVGLMAKHRNYTDIKVKFVTDNLQLSKEHLKYKHLYPNNTLKSEDDITEQIYLTNITYNIEATFQHVHGH